MNVLSGKTNSNYDSALCICQKAEQSRSFEVREDSASSGRSDRPVIILTTRRRFVVRWISGLCVVRRAQQPNIPHSLR
jgi:hypothetical protein